MVTQTSEDLHAIEQIWLKIIDWKVCVQTAVYTKGTQEVEFNHLLANIIRSDDKIISQKGKTCFISCKLEMMNCHLEFYCADLIHKLLFSAIVQQNSKQIEIKL